MKEWYLIGNNTKPNMLGGFENQSFTDYKDDAFAESLGTDIAETVTLCNFDLSETSEIRCIIQGNSADTQLKSMERVGLFMRGTVKTGMYIFFENRYWLITGYPSYNGIYEKAVMQLCQYKLRWQNTDGKIIERWCNTTSASKYDIGETGNSTIVLTSDNLTLLLPDDDECLDLDGKRVFIDKRKVNPTKVYKLTRTDGVLYDFGEEHGGVLSFIADKTELNTNADNQELRICDYIDPTTPSTPEENPDETTVLTDNVKATISGNKNLKVGFSRTYTATFTDSESNSVEDVDFSWNVVSDFEVGQTVNGNEIELLVEDEELVDEKFKLQVLANENVIGEIIITIASVF
jgi:hypothetical protein